MNAIHLKTQRLNLRPVEHSDLENIHDLYCLPETHEFNPSGISENIEKTKLLMLELISENQKERCRNYTFIVELLNESQFIGIIAINLGKEKYKNAEVWYNIHLNFWNKGYATETLKRIIDFGFSDLKLHRIEAGCAVNNIGSIRVLEKVGMSKEACRRKLLPLKTGWSDNFEYAILSTD